MFENEVICVLLPENIKHILLFCQDNFKFLASKLKFSTKVDLSPVTTLYFCCCSSYSIQYQIEMSQLLALRICMQGLIEEKSCILCRSIFTQYLDSKSSDFGNIQAHIRRVKVIGLLEKTWIIQFLPSSFPFFPSITLYSGLSPLCTMVESVVCVSKCFYFIQRCNLCSIY